MAGGAECLDSPIGFVLQVPEQPLPQREGSTHIGLACEAAEQRGQAGVVSLTDADTI